jgi:hypothetical protein
MCRNRDEFGISTVARLAHHRVRHALAAEAGCAKLAVAAADAWIDSHPLPDLKPGDIASNLANDTGGVAAYDFRHRYFDARHAPPQKNIDVIDRRGLHFYQHIGRAWFGVGYDGMLENLRAAVLVEYDCSHWLYAGGIVDAAGLADVVYPTRHDQ